ncbi:plasmid mobilization protein [Salmonella enterica]|nr:plasmid mobilization protein [Salmonella enterica]
MRCVRGCLPGGLLPVLPVFRPERSEHVRSGADNGCYGKCNYRLFI